MILPALAVTVALVVQDQTPLRASAHDNAPRQTALTAGDWLEVRGEKQGYVQVYDHRRERPGYVRPSAIRTYSVDEGAAPRLGALVEYLKDAPGEESLGIGYVALYLRAAPAAAVGPEVFDALGTMAERLGRRASARVAKAGEGSLAAQIEVAESYGVHFVSFEEEGRTRFCYDGEAFRHVLALGGTGPERVRAALGVTDPSCVDPALGQTAALELAKWRASVLEGVDLATLGPDVPTTSARGSGSGDRPCRRSSRTSRPAPATSRSRSRRATRRSASCFSRIAPCSRTRIDSRTKRRRFGSRRCAGRARRSRPRPHPLGSTSRSRRASRGRPASA